MHVTSEQTTRVAGHSLEIVQKMKETMVGMKKISYKPLYEVMLNHISLHSACIQSVVEFPHGITDHWSLLCFSVVDRKNPLT